MNNSLSILSYGAVHNISNEPVHFINEFGADENAKLSSHFPRIPLRRIPRYARMGLLACASALENYPKNAGQINCEELGLVVGTAYAGVQMSMDFMDSILDAEPRLSSPTAFSHAVNNMGAGLLSLYLGIQGPCQTITQLELSFVGALQMASTLIYSNRVEHVLVGCMDESDPRFTKLCANKLNPSIDDYSTEDDAVSQGAIFLLVTKQKAGLPQIYTKWNDTQNDAAPLTSIHYAVQLLQALQEKKKTCVTCNSLHSKVNANIYLEV